jgi:hypothetical protein
MRALTLASLSLCILFAVSCRQAPTKLPEPQAAQGPGSDSCAVYVQRVASGVRCQEVDAAHCNCELVAGDSAVAPTTGEPPLLTDAGPGTGGTANPPAPAPAPAPAAGNATLVFAQGPANTIVICRSGPCPVATAELISAPYPAVVAAPGGTAMQLEFHAAGHKPFIGNYTLYPGTNPIAFTLEASRPTMPDSAIVTFEGAPAGTTVQCVSGPCPDTKAHPVESFPAIPLSADDQTLLLRFNAPGYRTGMSSFQVSRGTNVVPVLMEKGTNGKR